MLDPSYNTDAAKYNKTDVTRGEFEVLRRLVNAQGETLKAFIKLHELKDEKKINTFPTEQEALKATMPLIPSGNMKIEQMILGATIMYNYLKKKLGE